MMESYLVLSRIVFYVMVRQKFANWNFNLQIVFINVFFQSFSFSITIAFTIKIDWLICIRALKLNFICAVDKKSHMKHDYCMSFKVCLLLLPFFFFNLTNHNLLLDVEKPETIINF